MLLFQQTFQFPVYCPPKSNYAIIAMINLKAGAVVCSRSAWPNVTLSLTARQLCFRLRGGKIMFYLIRHGQADYSEKHTKIYEGVGIDFSPLSPDGIRQIKRTAPGSPSEKRGTDSLLSLYQSPCTQPRSCQRNCKRTSRWRTDLHEWMANKNYQYNAAHMPDNYKEFMDCKGEYPDGIEREWEGQPSSSNPSDRRSGEIPEIRPRHCGVSWNSDSFCGPGPLAGKRRNY